MIYFRISDDAATDTVSLPNVDEALEKLAAEGKFLDKKKKRKRSLVAGIW